MTFVLNLDTTERVSIPVIRETLSDVEKVLADIEVHVRGTQSAEVQWELPESRPLEFIASVNGASAEDLQRIVTEAENGFLSARTKGPIHWPESFGKNAQSGALRILRRLRSIDSIRIRAMDRPEVLIEHDDMHDYRNESVSPQRKRFKRVASSVEGTLELVSNRGGMHASIKEMGTNNTISISFHDEMVKDIAALFNKRVVVEGLVSYRKDGTAISVSDVSDVRERKSGKSLLAYIGAAPDITGGASTDEFMDRMRGND